MNSTRMLQTASLAHCQAFSLADLADRSVSKEVNGLAESKARACGRGPYGDSPLLVA